MAITKKQMVEALVNDADFNRKELEDLLMDDVKEIFDKHFIEDNDSDVEEEDVVEEVVKDKNVPISKAEQRQLRRVGKI